LYIITFMRILLVQFYAPSLFITNLLKSTAPPNRPGSAAGALDSDDAGTDAPSDALGADTVPISTDTVPPFLATSVPPIMIDGVKYKLVPPPPTIAGACGEGGAFNSVRLTNFESPLSFCIVNKVSLTFTIV
jgi:hypothetical protein